ncbi:PREDICTED: spectrin beta chain, non-erythrocytic 2 [Pseudopodoces humilis]|nr:PREDICTED: spectrin beta chain, non-erythrocytic 2 [Pseudopodoces humilis]
MAASRGGVAWGVAVVTAEGRGLRPRPPGCDELPRSQRAPRPQRRSPRVPPRALRQRLRIPGQSPPRAVPGEFGEPPPQNSREEEEEEGSARRFERSRIKALADEREAVQKKTFTKWVNSHLARGSHLGDLYSDLRDGRLLLRLLEGLSGETLPRPTRGRMRIHCLENVEKALRFLREQRVHLENVGSHDIVDGNPRLTLGLVWTIILRFQIQDISVETGDTRERKSAKDALLAWCQMKTAGYPNVNVQNFTTSWRDGLAFCALIHRHRPELLDVGSLRGANALHNLQSAFAVAERELGVTRLLDPEDVAVEQPDERSVLTYVAALYHHFSRMKALAVEGKRVGKVLEAAREAEGLAGRYEAQAAELLGWIQRSLLLLTDRRLPRGIPGLQGQLQAFSAYRTTEKPPRFEDKGSLEVLLFSLRSRLRANNQRQFVPREGTHSTDINRAWERLEKAEHGRELALRSELLRQQHLEQLAARFHRKAALRETWLGDNQRLVAQDNFGGSLGGVEAALRKHEAIESDIAAYGSRVRAVTAVAAELEAERYHDMSGIATRRDHVVSLWEALRAQVAARRERLRAHLELQRLLRDLEHLMGWMEEMEVRLQSRDFGQHLSQVDDLLQIHALVEGDVAAQAERVRSVGAAAERFLGEGGGYRPCPPEQLRARVAALELRYRGLSALSAQRRLRLERSRRLWKFLWDAGEEEAWMREQERLLRCPELGRDLPGALRMLSQLEAIRGALGGRAGPLEQLLERGRELLAQGDPAAAAVSRRIRELESLWAALPALAGARERRLRAAAGRFQLDAEAAEAEAWLAAAARRVAGPELGHDERSAGILERRLRELQDEMRRRGPALAALREQALPGDAAGVPDVVPGLAERLAELERRHRELEARAELRRLELRDALGLFAARSEADACALWVGEREQWLLSMEIPERIEDLEVVQQRFETLEPELAALAARVASVGRVTQELQGSGDRNRESARETWEQLRDRWERFRALTERKKVALTAALNIHNFRLECHETRGWMREKTAAIEATRALGRDLAGITALQGKLSGMGRDLDAIQGKLRELRAEGEKLQGEQPERAPEIREGLAGLEAEWDALRRCHRSREESLGQARRLQGFLRDLAALQAWLSRTRAAAGSEDVPASLAEAEGSLRQHESLRTEISHYGADYRSARTAGREVTRGQTDPQSLTLLQRLEALDADWEELGRVWEKRQRLLAQAVAFHVFLRDAKQVEGALGKQEHALAHTEMPGTVPGAEAAVRRLEEFLAALDTGAERVRALTDTGKKLLDEGGVHAEKVRETVESVESRHQKIRESAQELLGRLRDNWELQKFLQDGQELTLWLNEKLPVARDVSYEGTRDLQGKWQKHQAFAAELAANRAWLEALEKDGEQLARARPALAGRVTAPRQELRALWAQVEAAAAAKGRGLAEAARAESCAQACAGLRSWLAGVRAQLRSGHCGQDLTSVGVLLTRHQLLETQAALREQEVGALRAEAGGLSPGHPRSAGVQEQVRELEQQFRELREPLQERGRSLAAARELHQFRRDLEDELLWVQERQALAMSTDHGKDLPSVQLLLQKNETLQKELQGRERRVTELLEGSIGVKEGQRGSDEPGAQAMLSRHLGLEQELRDYGGTVELLAEQGRAMAASGHPDGERLRARAAQVQRLYAGLCHLAGERRATLQGHHRLCQLRRDLDDLEQWISEREVVAASRELGQDFEHVTLLRDKFREFSRDTGGLGQERVDAANAAAAALIAGGHPERAAVAQWQAGLNEAWAELLELVATRAQELAAAHDLQRFRRDARQVLAQLRDKARQVPEELGRDLRAAEGLERQHRTFEHDVQALSAQVTAVQEAAGRLAAAYAGPRAEELRAQEGAVAAAWAELRGRCQRRRRLLGDTVEQFRFLRAARDLRLWMDGMHLQLQARERPRDVTAAELLIQQHQGLRAELEAREGSFGACVAAATALLQRGHHDADKLSQELAELQERRRDIGERWQDKLEWLQTVLEVLVFGRDAATAEAWLASREPLARAPELGSSLAEAETLLKRHQSFQKAAAAWDERFAALSRLTTLEEKERRRRQEEEEEARKLQPPEPPPAQAEVGGSPPVVPPERAPTPQSRPPEPPALNGIRPDSAAGQVPRGAQEGGPGPGGVAATLPPRVPPPPETLEGGLCRKQELEAPGKRATNRSWQSLYCVLRGGVLSVFKDARGAGAGVPYHGEPPTPLRGARCHPATAYRKRKHVFRLGLSDGKEFLFQAKDEADMALWLRAIEAAAGATLGPGGPREGSGVPGGPPKGMSRALSLPPVPPPAEGAPRPREPKEREKRFSFFKKNK